MNEWLSSLVLGIIQGVTEFLPVSSSGHLELAKFFLGDNRLSEQSLYFSIVLHFATALSTIVYFRKEIMKLFNFKEAESRSYNLYIIVSMIPAGFIGLFFDDWIEVFFTRSILLVACMLIVTGILLWLADLPRKSHNKLGVSEAFIIGVAQAVALIPGISRSGATISASLLLGISRSSAAQFSFLMVVPLIIGKLAKDIIDGTGSVMLQTDPTNFIIGFIAAFITGYLCCRFMVGLVKRAKLRSFSYYCFAMAIFTIGFVFITNVS